VAARLRWPGPVRAGSGLSSPSELTFSLIYQVVRGPVHQFTLFRDFLSNCARRRPVVGHLYHLLLYLEFFQFGG
jgi:hypothetical protein